MSQEGAIVWAYTVIIECPFCEESIRHPETGSVFWHSGDFLMASDSIFALHPPCDRLYEVSNPFEEPLDQLGACIEEVEE